MKGDKWQKIQENIEEAFIIQEKDITGIDENDSETGKFRDSFASLFEEE